MWGPIKSISGIITKGLGEGAYFMSMPHYRQEIKKKLGFDPYPGTLNLKVNENRENFFKAAKAIMITGYKSGGKTFGGASCYKAKVKNISGAVIVPEINKNSKNIIEFIAPVHVKSALNLEDDDRIEIELVNQNEDRHS